MNLLYILGNGFDLNLGLKTGYQDFYDYYKNVVNDDPDVVAMKKSIEGGRYSTWSDLEVGLGHYTKQVSDPDVFTKCLIDIKQCLIQFLRIQYEVRNYNPDSKKIAEDLSQPEIYLDEHTANAYSSFCKSRGAGFTKSLHIDVVSFNYTDTFEDIVSNRYGLVSRILHIHGQLTDSIVMGVSDMDQVSNVTFHGNRDIREEFIKPDYNDACLNARNSSFESLIDSADIIVLFGSSLGATDRKWWRLIGERMLKRDDVAAILYFPYDCNKDTKIHPNYRRRWTEEYQKELLKTFEIPVSETVDVLKRVFIGINTSIFALPMKTEPIIVGPSTRKMPK